jgi:hypothetical protein
LHECTAETDMRSQITTKDTLAVRENILCLYLNVTVLCIESDC